MGNKRCLGRTFPYDIGTSQVSYPISRLLQLVFQVKIKRTHARTHTQSYTLVGGSLGICLCFKVFASPTVFFYLFIVLDTHHV